MELIECFLNLFSLTFRYFSVNLILNIPHHFQIAKKGFPSMPKAEAARDFTKAEIDNKIVNVKLLRRDQYGRIVGQVTLG